MNRSVAMIHTVASLVPTFNELARELLPGITVRHFVDESLLAVTRETGHVTPATRRRLLGYVASAQELGVTAALVTCSSVGEAAEAVREFVDIPVVRVDEAMARLAVATGRRIGVVATLDTTLEPTRRLLEREAARAGGDHEVVAHLCAGAFEAGSGGDTERHDALVAAGISELVRRVDVLVLAQASMARALVRIDAAQLTVPVLTSPRSAVEQLAKLAGVA
jgi:Asp/Glu/hydantoin racemase